MKRIGLKRLSWENILRLKQDLLYFDQICFDDITLRREMILQNSVFQIDCITDFLVKNKLYDYNKELGDNIFNGQEIIKAKEPDYAKAIELMMKSSGRRHRMDDMYNEINFLIDQKLIVPVNTPKLLFSSCEFGDGDVRFNIPIKDFTPDLDEKSLQAIGQLFLDEFNYAISTTNNDNPFKENADYTPAEWIDKWYDATDRRLKFLSLLKLFENSDDHYIPIFEKSPELSPTHIRETEVLQLVLKKFPLVDQDTHWEQILEFKSDSNNQLRLLELRRWIRNMSNSDLNIKIINEEIDYLLATYERELRLRKIKFTQTPLEVFIVTALDILSDTVKLKWGDAARKLFEIKKAKADYLININQLAGKELGYITEIKEKLS